MPDNNTASIVNTAINALPSIIALIKGSQKAGDPTLTDAQVLEALQQAVAISIAKDEEWLRTHPTDGPPT